MSHGTDADYRHDALAAAADWHFWFVSRAALLRWAMRRYSTDANTGSGSAAPARSSTWAGAAGGPIGSSIAGRLS